jgi:hypothetical protein
VPCGARGGDGRVGVDRHVEVDGAPAARAREVLVLVGARVPAHRTGPDRHAPHHAELLEQLERGVDGGEREVRQPLAGGAQQLVRGCVPVELAQRTVQDHALGGDALPARVQGPRQLGVGGGRVRVRARCDCRRLLRHSS